MAAATHRHIIRVAAEAFSDLLGDPFERRDLVKDAKVGDAVRRLEKAERTHSVLHG